MLENPSQHVSCKLADPKLLPKYFLYLCKGPASEPLAEGKFSDRAFMASWIVFDASASRMVELQHRQFHETAAEIRASSSGASKGQWYEKLAVVCREKGASTRDDVMEVVCHYYVHESKKGFDKFAVVRTFWAVFALVNAVECNALILSQCLDLVRA